LVVVEVVGVLVVVGRNPSGWQWQWWAVRLSLAGGKPPRFWGVWACGGPGESSLVVGP
jgi:hypothetical protein